MPKPIFEENEARTSRIYRCIRNLFTYLFYGRLERDSRRRNVPLRDEEFFCDEFDDDTLGEIYSYLLFTKDTCRRFSPYWKEVSVVKDKEFRTFAANFCFQGNLDVFDKMTDYFDRMTFRFFRAHENPTPVLFIKVKIQSQTVDHNLDACFMLENNKLSKYTTRHSYEPDGELLMFEMGKQPLKFVVTFYEKTEASEIQLFSSISVLRRTPLEKQTSLLFEVQNVPYSVIGERFKTFKTEMRTLSRLRKRSSHSVDYDKYKLVIETNLKATNVKETNVTEKKPLDIFQAVLNKVQLSNTNQDEHIVKVDIDFHIGFPYNSKERNKDFRMHYLLYRLGIFIKSGGSVNLTQSRKHKVMPLTNKCAYWSDVFKEADDKLFLFIVKNHAIQKQITDGEDWACRCLAIFANIRYHDVSFEPGFIKDVLHNLEDRKRQFHTIPERIRKALHTACFGILCFVVNNFLRAINQLFQEAADFLADAANFTDPNSAEHVSTIHGQAALTKHILFGDWKAHEADILRVDLVRSLNCINQIISLSVEKDHLIFTFERHLHDCAIRWIKRTGSRIGESFSTFLQHLAIGDMYFIKAKMYSRYSAIMTSIAFLEVDEVKRAIDSQTKLNPAKQTISIDGEYLSKLFFYLVFLSNYVEQRHQKPGAAELFNLSSQIKSYLPATIAAAFTRETTKIVTHYITNDESFTPLDVSRNVLYCESFRQFMEKVEKNIVLAIESLKLQANTTADELAKAILAQARELKTNARKRLENERFFINPLKQGVSPQIYVVVNSFYVLADYLESNTCAKKLARFVAPMRRATNIEQKFVVFATELRMDARKIYIRVVETIMGMISQMIFHVYTGLETEGCNAVTIRNIMAMLSFQAKHKIQDQKVAEERLIDLWTEYLTVYERFLSGFLSGRVAIVENGVSRLKRTLTDTEQTLLNVVGISKDIVHHKKAFTTLCNKLTELSSRRVANATEHM